MSSSVQFGSFCRCWMHEERGVSWLYRTRGASNRTRLGLRTFLVAVPGIPHKRGIPIWYIVYVTQPKDIYFCCWEWGGVGESPVRKETIKFMLDSSDGPLLYAGLELDGRNHNKNTLKNWWIRGGIDDLFLLVSHRLRNHYYDLIYPQPNNVMEHPSCPICPPIYISRLNDVNKIYWVVVVTCLWRSN